MFAHQVVARHIEVEPPLSHEMIERIRADVCVEELLLEGRTGVLSKPDQAGIRMKFIDRRLLVQPKIVKLLANAFFVGNPQED